MIRRPPRSTRTDTLLPYTTLFRSPTDSLLDLLLRPLHLDLAIGRSGQVGEHDDLAWHLVPREACAHPVLQLGLGHEMRAHSDDGGHLLAPCRVRGADDNAVVDSRVLKKHVFDLLRVHLLPAGVDDPRVASEEADEIGRADV